MHVVRAMHVVRVMRVVRVKADCAARWRLAALVAASLALGGEAQGKAAAADPHVRFDFLTASLVRMQYSPSGRFVDAATAVVQKRDWPEVAVSVREESGWFVATTSAMSLRYRLHSGPFVAGNLEVTWSDAAGGVHRWHPGDKDPANLGGLTYSLDNISAANLPRGRMDLESPVDDDIPGIDLRLPEAKPGLLSRSGYAFLDDSRTPLMNAQTGWLEARAQPDDQDWYLFTYGRDYRKVLSEYAELCGPIPLIPRYVFGAWITDLNFEYFPDSEAARSPAFKRYGEQHLMEEISRLRASHIPLDVLVLDFAWHNYGWDGGYDWSPLIPHPAQLIAWLHARGIKLSLNDHPGYINTDESILSYSDSHAAAVLKALGRPQPPQPAFDMTVPGWRFTTDPDNKGLGQRWYAAPGGVRWKPIRTGAPWQALGYPQYRGVAWYRAAVPLPARLPRALYLYLGEVSKTYRLFINGGEVVHSTVHWPRRLTYADITSQAKAGQANDIVLRVESDGEEGGIVLGPVAIRDVKPPPRIYFDLSNQAQAEVSMRELHAPLMRQGVSVWWVDGGSGAADMQGVNPQLWTNKVFYDYTQRETGQRAFILGRYGDFGSERYPGFFTGDAYSEWPVLAYEVAFSARGGNVLVPYISHDIGGFHGAKIDFDLYARWIEFGAFSGLLRMHSAHENPREGNTRMPWIYGDRGVALMRKYFTLRTQLIPYLYTYGWVAHHEALPLLRPLYLEYPRLEEAYRHPHEYFLGTELLVAPVLEPSGNQSVYLPPGDWIDFFSGRHYSGGSEFTAHYAVDEMPVFVRAGTLVPEQPVSDYSDARPLDTLIVNVYGAGRGSFELYEDDGISLDYARGQYALTTLAHEVGADGSQQLRIGPARGAFRGQQGERAYQVKIHATAKPVSVSVNGSPSSHWSYDASAGIAVVSVPRQSIRQALSIAWH
jgi:alpha-glucosidase (family GH31 glycosyl hydrolase)